MDAPGSAADVEDGDFDIGSHGRYGGYADQESQGSGAQCDGT